MILRLVNSGCQQCSMWQTQVRTHESILYQPMVRHIWMPLQHHASLQSLRCQKSEIWRSSFLFTQPIRFIQFSQAKVRKSKRGLRWMLYLTIGTSAMTYFLITNPSNSEEVHNTRVALYRKMPLKAVSRVWGKMTNLNLPTNLRKPLLGLYVRMFGVDLSEANISDLAEYCSLSEFFRRELKPNLRIVDIFSPVTSPADGRVLHFGKVENGIVEQVKGVNYSIKGFLGPVPGKHDGFQTSLIHDAEYHKRFNIKEGNDLFQCIIYLAPGDYHRFHSSCDWTVSHRRHFPGELLSVNPGIARWIQGLFSLNERVVYSGTWEHGYFSYTAVGATNVGSIKVYFDKDLQTNIGKPLPDTVFYDKSFDEGIEVKKGQMIGEFNLGSTIVLMFEAPSDYSFTVEPGQKVKFGESLGIVKDIVEN